MNKPALVFNMDETGFKLNNKVVHVTAEKGSKNISCMTSYDHYCNM